ncbi:GNAT family N-acetyltransferase [Bryocella elongata]|uniref:GNAT family N-acetyltransferase n=1 Tax=Bryocella elongata TaxID=863522 RepID=UPI000CDE6215|nr:GNAT family N-acetyltransferase [Bryocella elongata]
MPTNTVRTKRLELVAISVEMLEADARSDASLGDLLGARVTHEWPPEDWAPHVLEFIRKQIEDEPHAADWHRYMVLREGLFRRTLVGCIGGFPKEAGDVEIGYSTLPGYQRRGLATEAARALIDMLLTREQVESVSAQTYHRLPESIKVMERAGMCYVGQGDEDGTVRYRRTRTDTLQA